MGKKYYSYSTGARIRNPGAYFSACRRNSGSSGGGSSRTSGSSSGSSRSYSSSSSSYSSYGGRSGTSSSGVSKYRSSSSSSSTSYSTGLYTGSGARIRNAAAYAATGARSYAIAGKLIAKPVAYATAVEARIRQNTDTPKHLYHYTSGASLAQIQDSGVIRASRGPGDCALGVGVYATALPPRTNNASLVANNWGARKSASTSKVDAYVRIDADRVDYTSGRDALGRNVFKVHGDVNLGLAAAQCRLRGKK